MLESKGSRLSCKAQWCRRNLCMIFQVKVTAHCLHRGFFPTGGLESSLLEHSEDDKIFLVFTSLVFLVSRGSSLNCSGTMQIIRKPLLQGGLVNLYVDGLAGAAQFEAVALSHVSMR